MEELRVVAEKRHTTASELIRQALVDYLDGRRVTTDTAATGT